MEGGEKNVKKITLSVMTIAIALVMVVGATTAYFTAGKVVSDNTFTTGSVTLGNVSPTSLSVTNLIPGHSVTKSMSIKYTGNVTADLYLGNRGNTDTPADYLADKLWVTIVDQDTAAWLYNGYADGLAGAWVKIADDVNFGWKNYDVTFTLDADAGNAYQGKTNLNTEFLFYAIQWDGPAPTTVPYTTTGTDPEGWD